MDRIFLGTAFSSGKVDPDTGAVMPEFRKLIEEILAGLRKLDDVEVFCAVEDEQWVLPKDPPEIGVQKDIGRLDDAAIFLALVEKNVSAGVQFEIGYAIAKHKPVILIMKSDEEPAYFNRGIVGAGLATLVVYDSIEMLINQLALAINVSLIDLVTPD